MGINASKSAQKVPENTNSKEQVQKSPENASVEEQGSIPSTPILTPKIVKEITEKEYLDPRSPSKHIARTPIELISVVAEKLQSLTLEANENKVLKETPLKNHILLGTDPRSPTIEIHRTPIIVSASPDKKFPEKLRNKNLDKVLKCALPATPNEKIVPPKLLESCLITPKPKSDAYKRKSFVLLETNVDFTETDLDSVIKEKYLGKSLQNLCVSGETSYSEISDPRSPTIDFVRTPIQIYKQMDDSSVQPSEEHSVQNDDKDIEVEKQNEIQSEEISANMEKLSPNSIQPEAFILSINEEDILPVSKEIRIFENLPTVQGLDKNLRESEIQNDNEFKEEPEHRQMPDSLLVNEHLLDTCQIKSEEASTATPCKKDLPTSTNELVISHLKQVPSKSAPVSPPSIVNVTPKKSKSQPVTPPLIDITADVKELDKKLTHLIYEDEDLVVCPRIVKIKEQNRTPLGLRNGTDSKKSSQKLKVSDKPRKAEYAVSKIPVFKEKKIKVQCENTPPKGMRGNKNKKSQWDAKDDTLVI